METSKKLLEGSTAVRHTNFLFLLDEFKREHMPDNLERGLLKAFGDYVGVSERYLSHVKCKRKPMGPKTARIIEAAMGKPVGWMDMPQGGSIQADNPQQKADLELMQTLMRAQPEQARQLMMEFLKALINQASRREKRG